MIDGMSTIFGINVQSNWLSFTKAEQMLNPDWRIGAADSIDQET